MRLGVNVDHIATLREARAINEPNPLEAVFVAKNAGAHQITIHLREDRRHIHDSDVRSIIAQFLIEAAVICGIGGIIGIVIGCLGTRIAGKFLLQGMVLWPNQTITIGAFLFSVVLGVLFGLYPAVKASGLQPVEALRAE